ncbi:hypothetical protein Corgl_1005 [Coriobacterium glomerans PW2]|uniref:Histidine kinase/HSP90-like ATPase domain-containing protein n=1 Tax=Coriobacterium glomerans (strain ATCC 49209 / DSM 20642 / JCM 10262 / PW2) TaxID=700015 RepID=F2N804_CORGP|nr:ATP-binding protein [Coriobacterium glomerans]AEB07113.1 hypothetical protein Corgl_1005 [Coriobacterium glomerans PW2]
MSCDCPNMPISLEVHADPRFARLVRMTAANVAMLSSMSVDRIEDIRMVAEEAFIYACSCEPGARLIIEFEVDQSRVRMTFELGDVHLSSLDAHGPTAVYTDLILTAVPDSYVKREYPAALQLELKADV